MKNNKIIINNKVIINNKISEIISNTFINEYKIKKAMQSININNINIYFDSKHNLVGGETEIIKNIIETHGNGKWNVKAQAWHVSQVFFNILFKEYSSLK